MMLRRCIVGSIRLAFCSICLLGALSSCRGAHSDSPPLTVGHGPLPLVFVTFPGESPQLDGFAFEMTPQQIGHLRQGIARLRKGGSMQGARTILGPPTREELGSSKEQPNKILARVFI